jgi:hypothetical protein
MYMGFSVVASQLLCKSKTILKFKVYRKMLSELITYEEKTQEFPNI